jgi:SAM-dependent methyltransferase
MGLSLGLSYRRARIDAELDRLSPRLGGFVLEVGAKRLPRGRWRPPLDRVRRWLRVNIDPVERPDVIADIGELPLRSGSADWIVCVEVLQYVRSPDGAMRELARVLGSRGAVVVAVPFLHRADGPTDRHRFTETRVRELLEGVGLEVGAMSAQGRLFATVANQLRQAAAQIDSRALRWLTAVGVVPVSALLLGIDGLPSVRRSSFLGSFTTGFVAVGRKRSGA